MRLIFALLFAAGLWGQTPLAFVLLTPCRIADTRATQPFTGALGPPSLVANVERDFPNLDSSCGVPASAAAYYLNIAVGIPYPGISTLNDSEGAIVANAAIVAAGTAGAIAIITSGPTDVVIDITGYFVPVFPTSPQPFVPPPTPAQTVAPGMGLISLTDENNVMTMSVDPAVVPTILGLTAPATSTSPCLMPFTVATDGVFLYLCTALNTWVKFAAVPF
jgi:hypothetical protein